MRRMSVAPELRACSARNGTIGAGQGRDARPGVGACSGDGELREYAETSPEASMEVNEYDSVSPLLMPHFTLNLLTRPMEDRY